MRYENPPGGSLGNTKTRIILSILSAALIVAVLSGIYLHFAWNRYQQMEASETLKLAQSVASLLHVEHISALVPNNQTEAKLDEHLVEESLVHLVEATDSIYYAYILKQQNGNFVVVADSTSADSATSQPMKYSCEETIKINQMPFETGQSVITEPISEPCGDWIRALVPIYDTQHKNVIAVLGLSYSASEWQDAVWKRMIPDVMVAAFLLLLVLALFNIYYKHIKLTESAGKLAFQEALYRNIFEQAPIGIALVDHEKGTVQSSFSSINPAGEAIIGRSVEELKKISWPALNHPDDLKEELPLFERFIKGDIHSYSIEKRLLKPDGSIVWVSIKVADFSENFAYDSMYLCLIEDISDRKQSEESLLESERSKSVFFSHIPGMAYRCKHDPRWTMEFVSEGCYTLTGYKAEELIANREAAYIDIIAPEYREWVGAEWERAIVQHKQYHDEYEIITKFGEHKWVLELGQGIYDDKGNLEALEGIVLDITEQKKKEHQITYLQEHDLLTGLYNRSYMEQEKKRLDQPEFWPLSLAICDVDGLRMINDAYGLEEGDQLITKTAKLIGGCLRSEYVLGHAGGGEFLLLLPHTDSQTAHQLKMKIKNAVESYNRANKNALYTISVSIGHSTKETPDQQIQDVIRAAEEYLSRRKLLNQNSSHSAIVSSIMATLYAKSQETEKHGQRIGEFCQMIGEQLGLSQKDLDDLQLLSKLHDIGKIGIDDRILNKPDKLTEDEWKIMKQHPEIGHRIAMATPQLEHIAEYILYHHERWDGTGYPMRLHRDEIPIISRILSIADAFDAMAEDRIYRKALPRAVAIREIERNAGTQFDPDIVRVFIRVMQGKEGVDKEEPTHLEQ